MDLFRFESIILMILALASGMRLGRGLLSKPFRHDRISWVRKLGYPPAYLVQFGAFVSMQIAGALLFGAMHAAVTGLYFVWLPSHATWLAAQVGVGRGVDLILYVWVVISLIVLLNLHLKLRVQTELITVLARELAIANARWPTNQKSSGT